MDLYIFLKIQVSVLKKELEALTGQRVLNGKFYNG